MNVSRVIYFDKQFLRPQDFSDEQAYHLALHRRHNIGAHIWGIVYGLEVVKDPVGNLAVQPGFAVDGYGRELLLPYPLTISSKVFDEKGSERLEVWLKYARLESDFATGHYAGCDVEQGLPTRSQEYAEVILQPPDPNIFVENILELSERRQPPGVPANDLLFDPTRVPPDDPIKTWPVYLGLLRRVPGTPPTVTIDLGGRPYAGLVGEMVRAPSGRAWMQVGSERKEDPYRFAVYLPEVETDPASSFPTDLAPRLGVTAGGEIHMRGDTTLEGDLTVDGGSIEFGVGPILAHPRPWRIYHVQGTEDPSNESSPTVHQLRIEMDTPLDSTPTGMNKVSIGVWSAKQSQFVPCLTVDDTCTVTVHGNLHVEGLLNAPNMSGQSSISQEARASTAGMMMMSLSQSLGAQATARFNLEKEIRSAAASIAPIAAEAAGATTDLQPKLDDAMKEVIKVLQENSLMPHFMTLLEQEANVEELKAKSPAPEAAAKKRTTKPKPTKPPTEPPTEQETPKTRTRSRRKKSE